MGDGSAIEGCGRPTCLYSILRRIWMTEAANARYLPVTEENPLCPKCVSIEIRSTIWLYRRYVSPETIRLYFLQTIKQRCGGLPVANDSLLHPKLDFQSNRSWPTLIIDRIANLSMSGTENALAGWCFVILRHPSVFSEERKKTQSCSNLVHSETIHSVYKDRI